MIQTLLHRMSERQTARQGAFFFCSLASLHTLFSGTPFISGRIARPLIPLSRVLRSSRRGAETMGLPQVKRS